MAVEGWPWLDIPTERYCEEQRNGKYQDAQPKCCLVCQEVLLFFLPAGEHWSV